MIRVRNAVASVLDAVADMLLDWSRHLRACPDCGRSRYYGEPCVKR